MKKLFYILLFFVFKFSFSQFNIIVEDTARNHIYIKLIQSDTSYIIQSGASDSLGNRGNFFTKFDTTGNIIWEKSYTKSGETWYEGYKYGLIKYGNNYISNLIKLKNYAIPTLMILDENFDTLYTKEYHFDTLNISFYSIEKSYNGFVLSGQKEFDDGTVKGYVIKINNNLDTLWTKVYNNGESIQLGNKIIETYDSSLISIGHTYVGTAIYKQDWYIVKTDSLGNLDWWLHPGNPILNDGSAADIIQTKDSCFVVVGGKAVYRDAGGTKFDGHIMKFDIDGNIIWDTTYRKRLTESSYDTVYCFFNSIVELDDGGFLVTANEQILMGGHQNSVLYRFNSEGDTLWTRHYCTRYQYTTIDFPDQEYPTTIQKTDNGGFLIGGWGYFGYTFDHPYTQQMFLIKTDSLGCDGTEFSCPDTSVYVSEIAEQEGFLVYPNPAKNNLQLVISNVQLGKNTSVFIYDVYGRLVRVIANPQGEAISSTGQIASSHTPRNDVLHIDISQLPKGVYFVKIGSVTKKFVKL